MFMNILKTVRLLRAELFRVQTNGTIRVNRDPSLEGTASVTPYVIVVRAQDSGSPQLYSDVTVRIYVQDSQFNERPTIDYPGQDGDAVNLTEVHVNQHFLCVSV